MSTNNQIENKLNVKTNNRNIPVIPKNSNNNNNNNILLKGLKAQTSNNRGLNNGNDNSVLNSNNENDKIFLSSNDENEINLNLDAPNTDNLSLKDNEIKKLGLVKLEPDEIISKSSAPELELEDSENDENDENNEDNGFQESQSRHYLDGSFKLKDLRNSQSTKDELNQFLPNDKLKSIQPKIIQRGKFKGINDLRHERCLNCQLNGHLDTCYCQFFSIKSSPLKNNVELKDEETVILMDKIPRVTLQRQNHIRRVSVVEEEEKEEEDRSIQRRWWRLLPQSRLVQAILGNDDNE